MNLLLTREELKKLRIKFRDEYRQKGNWSDIVASAQLKKLRESEEYRRELLRIENCETDVFCPEGVDEPCAECRTNQILALLEE